MSRMVSFAEVWRGAFLECEHLGQAVVCAEDGSIVQAWGDPQTVILPRSACKMVQALPLLESGAADRFGLSPAHLALACASHLGAAVHTETVSAWLKDLDLAETHLRCGPQLPDDREARTALIRRGDAPDQTHNNCSGKHTGFLTLNKHLGGGPDYVDPAHPVQAAVRSAFEELCDQDSPGFGIDGCSAPNFAMTLHGLAYAMARFASAQDGTARGAAMIRLRQAMVLHPELVSGHGSACTELMQATEGRVAIKNGAEGVYMAILPDQRLGVVLKIADGAMRGADCALASILVKLGALAADHPLTLKRRNAPIYNRAGHLTGYIHPARALM